jgi:hypothetical protein
MEGERLYSDKEVKALLSRAVEISRGEAQAARGGPGTSLEELRRIAGEAGLPAEALERALGELRSGQPSQDSGLKRLAGLERIEARLSLPAMPAKEALDSLLLDLPDIAGYPGSGAVAGGRLVWRSDKAIQGESGFTLRIEIEADRDGPGARALVSITSGAAAAGIYGGVIGGLGLGAGLGVGLSLGLGSLHSPAFATLVPIGALALSSLASRGIMALFNAWARRRVARISDELSRRLGRS